MTPEEVAEWLAYFNIEPMPDPWLQTGVLASTVVNLVADKKHRARPSDFIPTLKPKQKPAAKPQTAAEIQRAMFAIAAHVNAQAGSNSH